MKKYYAVRKGRTSGLFESWTACEKEIKGFSGAEYKSFKEKEAALEYLSGASLGKKDVPTYPCAYIDGSYDSLSQRFSYGAVVLAAEGKEAHFSAAYDDPHLVSMRNVAGEIKASEFAISHALAEGWSTLVIYYDYSGIEKWARGEWKRNLPATKAYFAFCQDAFQKINIHFIKIKSHSGNYYNDLADTLARKALNLHESE